MLAVRREGRWGWGFDDLKKNAAAILITLPGGREFCVVYADPSFLRKIVG
jgi:hypothetical protein